MIHPARFEALTAASVLSYLNQAILFFAQVSAKNQGVFCDKQDQKKRGPGKEG